MTNTGDQKREAQSGGTEARPLTPGRAHPGSAALAGSAPHPGAADTLVFPEGYSGEDEPALLGRVCRLLVTALPVAAAAVVLVDERLDPMATAAWPEDLRVMIAAQFERGEGPCVDACRTGEPVVDTDVAAAGSRHWAAAAGWRAVHTLPMRIDGRTVGCVTLASVHDGGLAPTETETGHDISAIAAAHAGTMRALRASRQLAAQLQHALDSRVRIEQAKGILAHRLNITVDEAFAMLRGHARTQGQPLADVAGQVVAGRLRLQRREEDGDVVVTRGPTGTPVTPEQPAARYAEVPSTGLGGPRSLLSIVVTKTPGRVRLIGDADLSTADQLAQALERLAEREGDITLDLGGLEFIDACSIGLLVRAATALPPPDRLLLRNATAGVARVLSLVDIGDHPRILIT